MNQEPFGGRSVVRSFDCIFNIYFYLCSLFIRFFYLLFLLVTYSLFIFSFVHSIWLLLKSSRSGRIIVCNAKKCWQKSSLQYEGWALSWFLYWYFVSFKWRQFPCVLMDCCDPDVTRSWRLFHKWFIHIQENCSDFSPRL